MSRMRLASLGLLVTGLLGCESDPSDMLQAPLQAGAEAMVYFDSSYGIPSDYDGLPALVRVELGSGQGSDGLGYDHLPVGTKVRVLEDAPGPDHDGKRLVKVTVLGDQDHTPCFGETVAIRRERLRLAPK